MTGVPKRQLTIRVWSVGDLLSIPRGVEYRLAVQGLEPGEKAGITLALYDGATDQLPARPGTFKLLEREVTAGEPLALALYLPGEYSGWAVREIRASGWALPFTVETDGPVPGATPAGPGLGTDVRFLPREGPRAPEPFPAPGGKETPGMAIDTKS